MSTEKGHTLVAPPDEMQQFKGRIICGRCGNSDWTKFTYMMPMNGRVLVQCSHCGLTFFEAMEPPKQQQYAVGIGSHREGQGQARGTIKANLEDGWWNKGA